MKRIYLLLLLITGISGYAQEQVTNEHQITEFSCQEIKYDPETEIIEYTGNVDLATDKIRLTNADQIIFDKKNNEIVAKGFDDFTFNGAIQVMSGYTDNGILRYRIGEDIAYLE